LGSKQETITAALIAALGILALTCGSHTSDALDTIELMDRAIQPLRNAYDAFNRGDIAKGVEELDPKGRSAC